MGDFGKGGDNGRIDYSVSGVFYGIGGKDPRGAIKNLYNENQIDGDSPWANAAAAFRQAARGIDEGGSREYGAYIHEASSDPSLPTGFRDELRRQHTKFPGKRETVEPSEFPPATYSEGGNEDGFNQDALPLLMELFHTKITRMEYTGRLRLAARRHGVEHRIDWEQMMKDQEVHQTKEG